MAYRATFWRPKPGTDPWAKDTPAPALLGDRLFRDVHVGKASTLLDPIPTDEILLAIQRAFPALTATPAGLDWDGGAQGSFTVSWSTQHVSICCFDLGEDTLDQLFDLLEPFQLQHFDR